MYRETLDSKQYKILRFLSQNGKQRIDAIFENCFCNWNNCLILNYLTAIFQCSKTYGSPTRVSGLKIATNLADPIICKENRPLH